MALTTNPLELLLNITRPNQPKPSASMDPVVGYSHWYWPHSKKNRWGNSSPPNQGFFHTTRKQPKKNYEIQFQLEDYTSYFSTAHMKPHEPTSSRRAKLCANHMSATMEVRGGSWYLGDIFCSEADMAMQSKPSAGLLVPQVQVGVENNGNIYNIYIYIHDVGMLPSPCQDASDHHDCYLIHLLGDLLLSFTCHNCILQVVFHIASQYINMYTPEA